MEAAQSALRDEEAGRICVAYLFDQSVPHTIENELLYRQRAQEGGVDITAKHAERDRLHAVAVALEAWVRSPERSAEDFRGFDPTTNEHWNPTDQP